MGPIGLPSAASLRIMIWRQDALSFAYVLQRFFSDTLHFYAYQHVLFRSVMAILTSLAIALLIGPRIIRWLMRMKIGDRPEFHHAALNELTKEKANTPTMGGLIILSSTIVDAPCCGPSSTTRSCRRPFSCSCGSGSWAAWMTGSS